MDARQAAMERVIRQGHEQWAGLSDSERSQLVQRVAEKLGIRKFMARERIVNPPCPDCDMFGTARFTTLMFECKLCGHMWEPDG